MQSSIQVKEIEPVPGAARYFAAMDTERNKYAVWMVTTVRDGDLSDLRYYTLSHHKSYEQAFKAANRWQTKENKSVLKHHPEMANLPIIPKA